MLINTVACEKLFLSQLLFRRQSRILGRGKYSRAIGSTHLFLTNHSLDSYTKS